MSLLHQVRQFFRCALSQKYADKTCYPANSRKCYPATASPAESLNRIQGNNAYKGTDECNSDGVNCVEIVSIIIIVGQGNLQGRHRNCYASVRNNEHNKDYPIECRQSHFPKFRYGKSQQHCRTSKNGSNHQVRTVFTPPSVRLVGYISNYRVNYCLNQRGYRYNRAGQSRAYTSYIRHKY